MRSRARHGPPPCEDLEEIVTITISPEKIGDAMILQPCPHFGRAFALDSSVSNCRDPISANNDLVNIGYLRPAIPSIP